MIFQWQCVIQTLLINNITMTVCHWNVLDHDDSITYIFELFWWTCNRAKFNTCKMWCSSFINAPLSNKPTYKIMRDLQGFIISHCECLRWLLRHLLTRHMKMNYITRILVFVFKNIRNGFFFPNPNIEFGRSNFQKFYFLNYKIS
jgi:hypothetical protein